MRITILWAAIVMFVAPGFRVAAQGGTAHGELDLLPMCSNLHPPSAGPCATRPIPAAIVLPRYTDEAKQATLEGTVVVSFVIDVKGVPRDLGMVKSLGMGLDEQAVATLQKWRFKPALYQNRPVPLRTEMQFRFARCKVPGLALKVLPLNDGIYDSKRTDGRPKQVRVCKSPYAGKSKRCATNPVLVLRVEPDPTKVSALTAAENVGELQITVTQTGLVAKVEIAKSLGATLDDMILTSVRQWKFIPSIYRGEAVSVPLAVEAVYGTCEATEIQGWMVEPCSLSPDVFCSI